MSSAEQISRLRESTGLGWLAARVFILENPPALCDRIVRAKETQGGGYLRDPIEDDPEYVSRIVEARAKAQRSLQNWIQSSNEDYRARGMEYMVRAHPRGSCHYEWKEMKRILAEEYGIAWFSPVEMNPGRIFD